MLRKQGRGLFAWLLAGTLLTTAVAPGAAFADTSSQLNQDQKDAGQMQSKLQQLNQQKQDTQNQVDQLTNEINDEMQKSAQLQQNIAETDKKLADEREKLKSRVKVMYIDGDVSFWNVLFGSTDFSDFLDRLSALTLIAQQDDNLITDYRGNENQLKQDQASLQAEQDSRKSKQQELLALEKQLDAQYSQVNSNLQQKQQQIDAEEAALATLASSYKAPSSSGAQNSAQSSSASSSTSSSSSSADVITSGGGTYIWPVPSSHTITSGYGPRAGGFHKGVDIGAPVGTPIVAVADGTVLYAGAADGFGHWVVIQHSNGLMSVYGHMYADGVLVSPGQQVKQGQVIARVGSDGESSGPHCHFSFATGISGGSMDYVNPMAYLQ